MRRSKHNAITKPRDQKKGSGQERADAGGNADGYDALMDEMLGATAPSEQQPSEQQLQAATAALRGGNSAVAKEAKRDALRRHAEWLAVEDCVEDWQLRVGAAAAPLLPLLLKLAAKPDMAEAARPALEAQLYCQLQMNNAALVAEAANIARRHAFATANAGIPTESMADLIAPLGWLLRLPPLPAGGTAARVGLTGSDVCMTGDAAQNAAVTPSPLREMVIDDAEAMATARKEAVGALQNLAWRSASNARAIASSCCACAVEGRIVDATTMGAAKLMIIDSTESAAGVIENANKPSKADQTLAEDACALLLNVFQHDGCFRVAVDTCGKTMSEVEAEALFTAYALLCPLLMGLECLLRSSNKGKRLAAKVLCCIGHVEYEYYAEVEKLSDGLKLMDGLAKPIVTSLVSTVQEDKNGDTTAACCGALAAIKEDRTSRGADCLRAAAAGSGGSKRGEARRAAAAAALAQIEQDDKQAEGAAAAAAGEEAAAGGAGQEEAKRQRLE